MPIRVIKTPEWRFQVLDEDRVIFDYFQKRVTCRNRTYSEEESKRFSWILHVDLHRFSLINRYIRVQAKGLAFGRPPLHELPNLPPVFQFLTLGEPAGARPARTDRILTQESGVTPDWARP